MLSSPILLPNLDEDKSIAQEGGEVDKDEDSVFEEEPFGDLYLRY